VGRLDAEAATSGDPSRKEGETESVRQG
jgi:hypothetical protein